MAASGLKVFIDEKNHKSMIQGKRSSRRNHEFLAQVFSAHSKTFPSFRVGARYLENRRSAHKHISFEESIETAVGRIVKASTDHPQVLFYSMAVLMCQIAVNFFILSNREKHDLYQDILFTWDVIERYAIDSCPELNGDFFENLMKAVFGIGKDSIEEEGSPGMVWKMHDAMKHWAPRLLGGSDQEGTSVHGMEYSELLEKFEELAKQDGRVIASMQNTGAWTMIRELYMQTMNRVGAAPSSVQETILVLQIDKACRDYSPSLVIGGGVVGSLRITRSQYLENVLGEAIRLPEKYPIQAILSAAKTYEYAPLLYAARARMQEKGATKEDVSLFSQLISLDLHEPASMSEATREKAKILNEESEKMSNTMLLEMSAYPCKKRESDLVKKKMMSAYKAMLASKWTLLQTESAEQVEKAHALVEKCSEAWRKVMGAMAEEEKSASSEEPQHLPIECSEGTDSACKEPSEEIKPSAFVPENMQEIKTKAEVEEKSGSKESPHFINTNVQGAVQAPASTQSQKSLGVGQSPKEQMCSDARCRVFRTRVDDSHLLEVSDAFSPEEEAKKNCNRVEELKSYFGGLKYACFYTKSMHDGMKNLFKTNPQVYKSLKPLYSEEFNKAISRDYIRVARKSLFRDAYIELIGARKNSEIINQMRDEVIFLKYMDTLQNQVLELVIAQEKPKHLEQQVKARVKPKPTFFQRIMKKVRSFMGSCIEKPQPLPSIEEEMERWETARRKSLKEEIVLTKNTSERVSQGFLNVSKALVDLIKYTNGYVYRKNPDTIDVKERYARWIVEEQPVDYEAVKSNPDELRALSMVFNRYIREYDGGIVSKYLYIAIAERAKKVPLEKIDYGLGLIMMATMGSTSIWILKHVIYTIEKVAEYEKTNFVSYQSIVNVVAPNLLADDVPYTLDTFSIALDIAHSLFAVARNVSFIETF
ncbi:uncharacterized protein NEMAJ01_1582 [Nematocida major]|uniref:uncharacterized protein n=1 Tax=Nematocida major TaxID=1912982 RepID=UPI0020072ABB|nr:uncharacterized protein NEMAJ01_1582 [Nematocida major]KAH9386686.1 hypothetical protein NEMAJ01_1582 [Nematocida major]